MKGCNDCYKCISAKIIQKNWKNYIINKTYNSSLHKTWIKLINLDKEILYENYINKKYFDLVANIELCKDEKLQRTIKFIPLISLKRFKEKVEYIYIFTINNRIVKIGGSRIGLQGRIISYLCGHHTKQRGKSGSCSKTNAFIYNTFEFYLKLGYKIQMYGYKLPKIKIELNILEEIVYSNPQTYHLYEGEFLENYKKINGKYPSLSKNCHHK